jgi:hypothetical protein
MTLGLAGILLLAGGCSTSVTSHPPRTAAEQLLLSTAADHALERISFAEFKDKRVFVDGTYFDSYDSKYVIGTVRDALSRAGAKLQGELAKSEVVVEVRSGALSVDSGDSLVGIPKTGVPTPLSGTLNIPEIALYKAVRHESTAKLAVLAYATESRDHFFSAGPTAGKAHHRHYRLLGLISWRSTNVPEMKRMKKVKLEDPAHP